MCIRDSNWLSQDEENARNPETDPITEEELARRISMTSLSVTSGGRGIELQLVTHPVQFRSSLRLFPRSCLLYTSLSSGEKARYPAKQETRTISVLFPARPEFKLSILPVSYTHLGFSFPGCSVLCCGMNILYLFSKGTYILSNK